MEIIRQFIAGHRTGFAAYLALEVALMRRFIARGGSPEEFCTRLAPAFRRRFAPVLLDSHGCEGPVVALPCSPRLRQEQPRRAA
jgi:hypothetical protein